MPRWRKIPEFPNYSVSDFGEVYNDIFERPVIITQNQRGFVKVGLSKDGVQYHRSLGLLVAQGFVQGESDTFNTPIHLDGDQSNCRWDNLEWRPRWFAVIYHAQFRERSTHTIDVEMRDLQTGVVYENSLDAAIQNGLIEKQLVVCTLNRQPVFPTNHEYEILGE